MKRSLFSLLVFLYVNLSAEVYNPPISPVVCHGANLFITGDFLYWKAEEDDLDYVAKLETQPPPPSTTFPLSSYQGKLYSPDFKWEPGFRVGIGAMLPYDGWDLYTQWTRLYSSPDDQACASNPLLPSGADCCPNLCEPCCNASKEICKIISRDDCCKNSAECCLTTLVPTIIPRSTPEQFFDVTQARARWRLRLNLLDGELGRNYKVGSFLDLRPFISLRGAWISQQYHADYVGTLLLQSIRTQVIPKTISGTAASKTRIKNDFTGVGPRLGFDTDWILGKGFSIYGHAAIGLLFGEFDIHSKTNLFLAADLTFSTGLPPIEVFNDCAISNLKDEFHSSKACTDLELGIQWEKKFLNQRMAILLQLGWDFHIFFGQNQIIYLRNEVNPNPEYPVFTPGTPISQNFTRSTNFIKDRRSGDLSLQGLTFSARLDF
jgi:Legionella pneumophila major outer membrane protein precursor